MLFERYAVQLKVNDSHHDIFDVNFEDELFEEVEIESETYKFTQHHYTYQFANASYENLIAIFTKPEVLHTTGDDRELYHTKIAYVKTKENQVIVNTQNWDVVNHLNEYQGLIDFIDIYIIPYDNMAKIAIEYKYHALPQTVLFEIIKYIFVNGFIGFGISFEEDLDIVKDYFQTDFEATFNSSRRNKKIIVYMDTVNNGTEVINSAKIEYSVKANISLENTMNYLHTQYQDNTIRYSIKCEDEDNKTALITAEELRTNASEWETPARTTIDTLQIDTSVFTSLSHFLRISDD